MLSNHLWLPCAVLPCADIEYLHCHRKFYQTALIYSNNFLIFSTDISVHNSVPSLVSLKWALDLELSSSLIFTTLYQLSLIEMISQVLMWFCLIWQFWSVDTAAWTEARRIQRLVLDSGGKAKACEPRGRAATWVLRLWQVLTRHPRHGGCPASLSARGLEWLGRPLGRQTWQAWVACMLSRFSCVQLFVTPRTIVLQAPLSMRFLRQEYWSGLPFPSPGDLPDPGMEPESLYISCISG